MTLLHEGGDPPIRDGDRVDPVAFFESAAATFRDAKAQCGRATEFFFHVGAHTIRLEFAGDALPDRMTHALRHLATAPSADPAITILLWDNASTHTKMPPPPWRWRSASRGEIDGYNTDRIYTAYNYEADVLNVLDLERRTALYWTRDARHLPSYEISAPLRTILNWIVTSDGGHVVHGAAVGTPAGGVLLAGRGGSGKSTTALSCLRGDLKYVSDDYCLLTLDPVPSAHSLYCSAKLHADNLERVPHVIPCLSNPGDLDREKAVLFLHDGFGDRLISGFPLLAILLPRIRDGTFTELVPATSADALKALALSTIAQLPRAGHASVQFMKRLAGAVPSYHLQLGTDVAQIPSVIAALIQREVARQAPRGL